MSVGSTGSMLVFLLALGCSTTSTIARVNGPPLEGDIVGGSRDTIFVRSDENEFEIPRDDISSVDYPGNVHAAVGGGVLAYGALNIAVGLPKCNDRVDNKAAYCAGVFLPAAIGAGLLIWGLIVHHDQTSAFGDVSRESLLQKPAPRPLRNDTPRLPTLTHEQELTPAPGPNTEPVAPGSSSEPAAPAPDPAALPVAPAPESSSKPDSTRSFPPDDLAAPARRTR